MGVPSARPEGQLQLSYWAARSRNTTRQGKAKDGDRRDALGRRFFLERHSRVVEAHLTDIVSGANTS